MGQISTQYIATTLAAIKAPALNSYNCLLTCGSKSNFVAAAVTNSSKLELHRAIVLL